ncbi:REP-associated tyrosine transposase [Thalassoglobus sp.]|uniref:REP-associated tyrosine transposase n=1 Tax=Thalassoglobus sp. TaxID=2795869 RepID=UPI003AA7B5D4
MPNYRRAYIPGGTFFFTVVTYGRRPIFRHQAATKILGDAFRECKQKYPFEINAIVVLPDHLHCLWTLPRGDHDFSKRWSIIKRNFTSNFLKTGGKEAAISDAQTKEGRKGIWQPRFWEHAIEDIEDYEAHFDYIHFNPVKHGYARCPKDWQVSSFHRWVNAGVYPENWACGHSELLDFDGIEDHAGEPF